LRHGNYTTVQRLFLPQPLSVRAAGLISAAPARIPGRATPARASRRSRRVASPRDFGGDALKNLGGQPRVDQNGEFGLTQHVDEARRDDFAGGIDAPSRLSGAQVADGRNTPVSNADVSRVPRRTRAIDDVAFFSTPQCGRR
jgi:hypothetical protein